LVLGLLITAQFLATSLLTLAAHDPRHDGPDPIGSWELNGHHLESGKLNAVLGSVGRVLGEVSFVEDPAGEGLYFDGRSTRVVLAENFRSGTQKLPKRHLTISAWVSINSPKPWGGILGVLQDNGDAETGWILGYGEKTFTFGLASVGANDGNGSMTYLRGRTVYEEGLLYHVAATYDGKEMRLFVNGHLEAASSAQSGDVLYPQAAPLVIGGYFDRDEKFFHHGRIRSVRLYDQAANEEWLRDSFSHSATLAQAAPYLWLDPEHRWVIEPYLQMATRESIVVRWETSRPSSSLVRFAEAVQFEGEEDERRPVFSSERDQPGAQKLHEVLLDGLKSNQAYYYQVESQDDLGRVLTGSILSFQTACEQGTPFAFAVISDTQGNPEVSGKLATLAWGLRPNFLLHPGDLVSTGGDKRQWVEEFFASMKPLIERVPFYPVLGNHEQDARYYYDYVTLPTPEYYYTFEYGNAQFFMIDSNRKVDEGSEQYLWLDKELGSSKAAWKIVCYHHPAYSSDENDYGDTWTGPSTRGDTRTRELVALYDFHAVDLVWNGHIHSYERTWPLRNAKAVPNGTGTVYMITGGGGGSLETPGPIRPWFQNNVRRGHHFSYVAINGMTLEIKSFDQEGHLFDHLEIEKGGH
jgi:hypothetical protein